jgi:hypothetical protein
MQKMIPILETFVAKFSKAQLKLGKRQRSAVEEDPFNPEVEEPAVKK